MRRRLEQLLNGRFEYEVPHLLLSETEVALTLDEGQNFRGELNIGAEDGRRVKGIVTTDHQRIVWRKISSRERRVRLSTAWIPAD